MRIGGAVFERSAKSDSQAIAGGIGSWVEFLRRVKDYSGNFSEELKAFKGEAISDEDLKTMEHLNVSWGRFVNSLSKTMRPSLVRLTEKMAKGLDYMTEKIPKIAEGVSKGRLFPRYMKLLLILMKNLWFWGIF
jgi:hypothetical protein